MDRIGSIDTPLYSWRFYTLQTFNESEKDSSMIVYQMSLFYTRPLLHPTNPKKLNIHKCTTVLRVRRLCSRFSKMLSRHFFLVLLSVSLFFFWFVCRPAFYCEKNVAQGLSYGRTSLLMLCYIVSLRTVPHTGTKWHDVSTLITKYVRTKFHVTHVPCARSQ